MAQVFNNAGRILSTLFDVNRQKLLVQMPFSPPPPPPAPLPTAARVSTGTTPSPAAALPPSTKKSAPTTATPPQTVEADQGDDLVESADAAELREAFKELGLDIRQLDTAQQTKALKAARALGSGDTSQRLEALAQLANVVPLGSIAKVLETMKVGDSTVTKLAGDTKALKSLQTLASPEATETDQLAAALTLANSFGQAAPKATKKLMERYLGTLPAAAEITRAIGTWTDPKASPQDKAQAALDVAKAAQTFLGTSAMPELKQKLRAADSLLATVGAGLTLMDKDATLTEKAEALGQLAANVPDLRDDSQKLMALMKGQGMSADEAKAVARMADNLDDLKDVPKDLRKALSPELVSKLSADEIAEIKKLSENKALVPALTDTLSRLKKGESVSGLLDALAQTTGGSSAQETVLKTLSGMREGEADKFLASTVNGKPAAKALAEMTSKLDAKALEKLPNVMSELNGKQAQLLFDLVGKDTSKSASELIQWADKIGSKEAGRALSVFDNLLGKAGIELTEKVATKLSSGLKKILPVVGAAPALESAAELFATSQDKNLPEGIRFIALQGAKLNGTDAVLSVLEPFIAELGVPVAVDLGLAGAELAIDLIVADQIDKFKADPKGYKTPAWLEAVNVASAVAAGPQGMVELGTIYGANGEIDLLGRVARSGGTAAIKAAEVAVTLPADALNASAQDTAQGLHLMADIIRNPQKYGAAAQRLGQQAAKRLGELAHAAGDLGKAAARELKLVVTELADLGVKGVKALGWIATHPGEAAAQAAQVLGDLAQQGLTMGRAAGRELARASLDALGQAKRALGAAGDAVGQAYQAVSKAIDQTADAAVAAGAAGIQTLAWIVRNPGEASKIAGDALAKVGGKAGEFAQDAISALGDVCKQAGELGQRGLAWSKQVVSNLKSLGEAGVVLLEQVAKDPGYALSVVRKAAGEALSDLARTTGRVAEQATTALLRLVDNGVGEVKDTVVKLLSESEAAVARAAKHWGTELSEGAHAIVDGLKDLEDAGKGALVGLARMEIEAAKDVLNALDDAKDWVWDKVT
jgi:hypothetical protein